MTPSPRPSPVNGLRNRKKLKTRQAIATAAARLFDTVGYESVRMKDIARAADVSEQTLYNYFPTKEHLIFDQQQEFESRILDVAIRKTRSATLPEALAQDAEAFLEEVMRNVARVKAFPVSLMFGPELRRVWIEMNARHADTLTEALLRSGKAGDRASAKFLARAVVALFAVVLEGVGEAAVQERDPAAIRRELRSSIRSITSIFRDGVAPAGTIASSSRARNRRPAKHR